MTKRSLVHSRQLKALGKGISAIVLALLLWLARQPLVELLSLLKDREVVVAYLQGYGAWGPILLAAIIALQAVIAMIPGHVFMIAGGYLYGFTVAFLIIFVRVISSDEEGPIVAMIFVLRGLFFFVLS